MAVRHVIEDQYETYLEFLRNLIGFRTEFQSPQGVLDCANYCRSVLEENLPSHRVYLDALQNVIAVPQSINPDRDLLYLSAHLDTVGAEEEEWDPPFHPWNLYEDEHTLVARGVNDCKAGVAAQLFLSMCCKEGLLQLSNVLFTLTFKEEGAGRKTATAIGEQIGKELPLSTQSTYLVVLENTVSVADVPTLSVYLGERSSYVVSVEGEINALQTMIEKLDSWNPVSIEPTSSVSVEDANLVTQESGHVCSVSREENKLTSIMLEAQSHAVIRAGSRDNVAVVPSEIRVSQSACPVRHRLVLSNRSFDTLGDIQGQLSGLEYIEEKEITLSTGFNKEKEFYADRIAHACENNEGLLEMNIAYTYNIGASDATIILRSMDPNLSNTILPIVMGPGSRSQRSANPPRLTHGKNETFDKHSGQQVLIYIISVLQEMGFVGGVR